MTLITEYEKHMTNLIISEIKGFVRLKGAHSCVRGLRDGEYFVFEIYGRTRFKAICLPKFAKIEMRLMSSELKNYKNELGNFLMSYDETFTRYAMFTRYFNKGINKISKDVVNKYLHR